MVDIVILDHLTDRLDVSVFSEFPAEPPDRFVILRRGGSSRENLLDSAMFVADSYGPSLYQASVLNDEVKTALDALTELPRVSASRLQNSYPAYDAKNKKHRYQAVYDITHY